MFSKIAKQLLLVYILITLGGLFIHLKIHPPAKSLYFWWASPVNIVSVFLIPALFLRAGTAAWGVLLNAMVVGIGTVGMAYFSILNFEGPLSISAIFLKTTLPDILILWAKIPLASLLYQAVSQVDVGKQARGS